MNETSGTLACLECGEPILDGSRWLCSARCAAVMTLVRYGRSNVEEGAHPIDPDGLSVDQDLLNRYRRKAGIIGRFPSLLVRQAVRGRDGGRCQDSGCAEREVTRTDWCSDDPVLTRPVRVSDLRTLCVGHHREVSLHRFVGKTGHVARTGPAIWARIVSLEPLAPRDNAALWSDRSDLRILTNWPVTPQTRRDLHDWVEALGQLTSDAGSAPRVASRGPDDTEERLNAALDRLALPTRRRARLVRTVHALLLKWQVDEAPSDAMRQET